MIEKPGRPELSQRLRALVRTLLDSPRVVLRITADTVKNLWLALGDWRAPLIAVYPAADKLERRTNEFHATLCGRQSRLTIAHRWQLNEDKPEKVAHPWPRAEYPEFAIDIPAARLRSGSNVLRLTAISLLGRKQTYEHTFHYDPTPVELPLRRDWSGDTLDSQDGYWECLATGNDNRVRPAPGHEGFDRTLVVCGAFTGPREVCTTIHFRQAAVAGRPFGFGLMPLWGGRPLHPDTGEVVGWLFGMAGYYLPHEGAGLEFSRHDGHGEPAWVANYGPLDPRPDGSYRFRVQALDCATSDGPQRVWHMRMKCWAEGQPQPDAWLELTDTDKVGLPEHAYGVAVFAHACQAEFGTVEVKRPTIDAGTIEQILARRSR